MEVRIQNEVTEMERLGGEMHFHDLHIKMVKGEVKTWTNHCRQKHPEVTRTRSWSHVSEWPQENQQNRDKKVGEAN